MSTAKAIREACGNLDVTVRSYSGRGMYGKACVGFDVERGQSVARFAFRLAVELSHLGEEGEDAISDLCDLEWREDSMGMGAIAYLPGLPWEGDEEEAAENEFEGEDPSAIARFIMFERSPQD